MPAGSKKSFVPVLVPHSSHFSKTPKNSNLRPQNTQTDFISTFENADEHGHAVRFR